MACYTLGLDLGQVRDYSALVLAERVQRFDRESADRYYADDVRQVIDEYHVRHIQRWELGTPYPSIVEQVCDMMSDPQLRRALLVIDRTGVGGAVEDLFKQAYRDGRMGEVWPRATTLTAGFDAQGERGGRGVASTTPKGDLIMRSVSLAQRGRLQIPPSLPLADRLLAELRAYELKLSERTGHVKMEARRESDHDDLVIALALAVWPRNRRAEPRYFGADGDLQEKG